ncbi:MAG: hypothetical protein B6242_12830 [Anaerolineaceae bacterium 4572_78]|nr:MAG: hypothetical protein B6242_12830 [Anaerolineaceae bacterium 4572_78]
MQTYHFDEIVSNEGTVTLSGLPPLAKIAVVVIDPEPFDWQYEMEKWMQDIRKRHSFAKMTKEEILVKLHQTREEVYEEDYGYRHAN